MLNPRPNYAGLSITVVVPCFNEEKTILEALRRVRAALSGDTQIIVVDDGSTDRTLEILQRECANLFDLVIIHEKNRGKGAALHSGFAKATKDLVVVQDADMEYDPFDIPRLIGPIAAGKADVVFGSRFLGSDARRVLLYWHSLGNKFLTTFSNMFTNLNLTDMETGYKMFRRETLQQLSLREQRFGFEPEVVARIARLNLRIYEVGISYAGRTYSEGKKISWKDGFSAIRCILKYSVRR
ncbi:glycosyltransferase family 2 protein [Pontimonas sp.]|nr:glycosyltransferase family 2 protein [Pontimonas sp.]